MGLGGSGLTGTSAWFWYLGMVSLTSACFRQQKSTRLDRETPNHAKKPRARLPNSYHDVGAKPYV